MGPAPIRGRQPGDPGTHSAGTNTERLFQDPMSALQITPRPSRAGTQSTGSGYAAVRTAVRTDRDTSVLARAAVGIMLSDGCPPGRRTADPRPMEQHGRTGRAALPR